MHGHNILGGLFIIAILALIGVAMYRRGYFDRLLKRTPKS
jgi:hypothetical protein